MSHAPCSGPEPSSILSFKIKKPLDKRWGVPPGVGTAGKSVGLPGSRSLFGGRFSDRRATGFRLFRRQGLCRDRQAAALDHAKPGFERCLHSALPTVSGRAIAFHNVRVHAKGDYLLRWAFCGPRCPGLRAVSAAKSFGGSASESGRSEASSSLVSSGLSTSATSSAVNLDRSRLVGIGGPFSL
jgi:hypothetical protein